VVCCSVVQCVAVWRWRCSAVSSESAVCCSVLQCVAVCCSVLQYGDGVLFHQRVQCDAACCGVLQRIAVCCGVLQCVAVCCSVEMVFCFIRECGVL